jgi:hypothetical protein
MSRGAAISKSGGISWLNTPISPNGRPPESSHEPDTVKPNWPDRVGGRRDGGAEQDERIFRHDPTLCVPE